MSAREWCTWSHRIWYTGENWVLEVYIGSEVKQFIYAYAHQKI